MKINTIRFLITNKTAIAILLLIWAIIELLIFPVGEFPLNDDWCYAIPIRNLVNGEKLRIVNWGSMTLLTQIGWGYLFSSVFGFSFLTLRISVIVLGIIGSIYLYYILVQTSENKVLSLFLTLLYVANPLHINLVNTFMTDVPFCTFAIVSIYYIKRMYETDFEIKFVVIANLMLIATILLRQLGLFMSIAIFTTLFFTKDRRQIICCILPLILGALTLYGYEQWLLISGNAVNNYYKTSNLLSESIGRIGQTFYQFYHRTGYCFQYIGLVLLPVSTLYTYFFIKNIKNEKWKLVIPVFIIILLPILRFIPDFPYGNVLTPTFLGAKTLYDVFMPGYSDVQSNVFSTFIFKFLGFLGGATFAIMILSIAFSKPISEKPKTNFFLIFICSSILAYMALIAISPSLFDRYSIPLVFLSILFIASNQKIIVIKSYFLSAAFHISVLIFVGILGTKDYFSWNRIKIKAHAALIKSENLKNEDIHAGVDYNAWLVYNHDNPVQWKKDFDSGSQPFIIAFKKDIYPYSVYKTYPYQRLFLPSVDTLYVLKRN